MIVDIVNHPCIIRTCMTCVMHVCTEWVHLNGNKSNYCHQDILWDLDSGENSEEIPDVSVLWMWGLCQWNGLTFNIVLATLIPSVLLVNYHIISDACFTFQNWPIWVSFENFSRGPTWTCFMAPAFCLACAQVHCSYMGGSVEDCDQCCWQSWGLGHWDELHGPP